MLGITPENTVWKRSAWIPPAMQLLKSECSTSLRRKSSDTNVP